MVFEMNCKIMLDVSCLICYVIRMYFDTLMSFLLPLLVYDIEFFADPTRVSAELFFLFIVWRLPRYTATSDTYMGRFTFDIFTLYSS